MVTEGKKVISGDRRVVETAGDEGAREMGIEDIDPRLIQQLVSLDDNEVIVPLRMKREDVSKVKAVKLSEAEVVTVSKFQVYLYDRGYLQDNTFASLFVYLFRLGFTLHKQLAEEEARKEAATR